MHSHTKDRVKMHMRVQAELDRDKALMKAADGMTTADAVKYITHGPDMWLELSAARATLNDCAAILAGDFPISASSVRAISRRISGLLTKLDKEGA